MLGKFREIDQEVRSVGSRIEAADEHEESIVHKTGLNDGGPLQTSITWRDYVRIRGITNAVHRLYVDFEAIKTRRLEFLKKKHPYTSIIEISSLPRETATEKKRHRTLESIYADLENLNGREEISPVDFSTRFDPSD